MIQYNNSYKYPNNNIKMSESPRYDRVKTFLLYQQYLGSGHLSDKEKCRLIDGLAGIIQQCYDNSLEPDKIYLFTERFTRQFQEKLKRFKEKKY